jgi:hypothetical protein
MFRKSATLVVAAATVLLSSGGAYAMLDGERLRLGQPEAGNRQTAALQTAALQTAALQSTTPAPAEGARASVLTRR